MSTPPSVFPIRAGDDLGYSEYGIDVHDLAAVYAFHALVGKFGERYSGVGLDQLAEQAWKAADAFLDARRSPLPRPKKGDSDASPAEVRKLVEDIARASVTYAPDDPVITALLIRARKLCPPAKSERPEGGVA